MTPDPVLRVAVQPSRGLAAVVGAAHLCAGACAAATLPASAAALVAAGLVLSLAHHARVLFHASGLAVAAFELAGDGRIEVESPYGDRSPATLESAGMLGAWLTVLALRDATGRRRDVVLVPSRLDADAHRRVRVWLRWRYARDVAQTPRNMGAQ